MVYVVGAFVVLVVSLCFIWWMMNYIHVKMPEQQRDLLDQAAWAAVRKVEHQYSLLSGEQKKHIALQIINDAFAEARLALLGDTLIDTTIEAYVYLLNHDQATLRLEKLKADIAKARISEQITDMRMPIVLLPVEAL